MRNGKKILAGCLLAMAVSTLMVGCGNNDNNTTVTENATGTTNVGTTEKNTIQNDGADAATENRTNTGDNNMVDNPDNNADGGVLEDVGAGIGEAGDDIIDGAADAVDRLADDGIDSENTGNTNTGVQ